MKNVRRVRAWQMLVVLTMTMVMLVSCGGQPAAAPAASTNAPADGAAAGAATADVGIVVSAPVEGKENITY